MRVQLSNEELDGLRATIDGLIAQALHYKGLSDKEAIFALHTKYGATACALYRAANSVLMSQGVLCNEYMDRPEWATLRRLALKFNGY